MMNDEREHAAQLANVFAKVQVGPFVIDLLQQLDKALVVSHVDGLTWCAGPD